ncbi:MAG TPA: hypothetical protein VGM88_25585 [Kofleriaceae bacterium]|jgi:hypothetical protein
MCRREATCARAVLVVALAGCSTVANAPAPDPTAALSEPVFHCRVEPILVKQCSYVACHGNAGAALRVYSPGKLRATPAATLDDQIAPLTADEDHANFLSAAAFSADTSPADNWLIRKPLAASAGGYEHVGGAIWDTGNADSKTISDWLAGTGSCP